MLRWRARAHREVLGRHTRCDGGPRADVGAVFHFERRHQRRIRADEDLVADAGRVLVDPVVVARDRAGADVAALADERVAEIRQVARLRAGAQPRLLRLDEVADPGVLAQLRAGTQAGERTHGRAAIDTGAIDHGVRLHGHAVGQHGVADDAVRADANVCAQFHAAFEDHSDIDDAVQSGTQRPAEVEPRGIAQCHAGAHGGFRIAPLVTPFGLRELDPVVDAKHLLRVGRWGRPRREPHRQRLRRSRPSGSTRPGRCRCRHARGVARAARLAPRGFRC